MQNFWDSLIRQRDPISKLPIPSSYSWFFITKNVPLSASFSLFSSFQYSFNTLDCTFPTSQISLSKGTLQNAKLWISQNARSSVILVLHIYFLFLVNNCPTGKLIVHLHVLGTSQSPQACSLVEIWLFQICQSGFRGLCDLRPFLLFAVIYCIIGRDSNPQIRG